MVWVLWFKPLLLSLTPSGPVKIDPLIQGINLYRAGWGQMVAHLSAKGLKGAAVADLNAVPGANGSQPWNTGGEQDLGRYHQMLENWWYPQVFLAVFSFSDLKKDAQVSNFTPFYLYIYIITYIYIERERESDKLNLVSIYTYIYIYTVYNCVCVYIYI